MHSKQCKTTGNDVMSHHLCAAGIDAEAGAEQHGLQSLAKRGYCIGDQIVRWVSAPSASTLPVVRTLEDGESNLVSNVPVSAQP